MTDVRDQKCKQPTVAARSAYSAFMEKAAGLPPPTLRRDGHGGLVAGWYSRDDEIEFTFSRTGDLMWRATDFRKEAEGIWKTTCGFAATANEGIGLIRQKFPAMGENHD